MRFLRNMYSTPAHKRISLSGETSKSAAICSARSNEKPIFSLHNKYGFCFICSAASEPKTRNILTQLSGDTEYADNVIITSRMPYCLLYSSDISCAFCKDIPLIAASSLGWFCIISSASAPNFSTILPAVVGPTPLIAPEER